MKMTKYEFLDNLRQKLSMIPPEDREKSVAYYSEMLDDCMEDGMDEEEAVASLGSVDAIAEQILEEVPVARLIKEKVRPKRKLGTFEIVLLVLGSPIWLSLLVSALAVIVSLFVAVWTVGISVIASLWAVGISVAAVCLYGLLLTVLAFCQGFVAQGICYFGIALILAALSILIYFASLYTTVGCVKLAKNMYGYCKRKLTKRGKKNA